VFNLTPANIASTPGTVAFPFDTHLMCLSPSKKTMPEKILKFLYCRCHTIIDWGRFFIFCVRLF